MSLAVAGIICSRNRCGATSLRMLRVTCDVEGCPASIEYTTDDAVTAIAEARAAGWVRVAVGPARHTCPVHPGAVTAL